MARATTYCLLITWLAIAREAEAKQEIVMQKEGVTLSHKGLALHSTTDIYIALKTHLATDHLLPSSSKCEGWTKIREQIKEKEDEFFKEIEEMIPCHFKVLNDSLSCKGESRVKRGFLSSLLGLGIGTLGLFNFIDNHKITGAIDSLKLHDQELTQELFKLKDDLSKEHKILRNVILQVKYVSQGLHTEITKLFCEWISETRQINSLINSYLAKSKIKNMITDILMNRLSIDILNPTQVHKIVKSHPLLLSSIYAWDIGLFFTLAKTFLFKIDFRNRIIDIIITVPMLKYNSVASIYQIHNLGVIFGEQYAKFQLPNLAYIGEREILEMEENSCEFNNFVFICRTKFFKPSSKAKCLAEIYFNQTTNSCRIDTNKSTNKYEYIYTENGLIFTSTVPFYMTYRNSDGLLHTIRKQNTINSSIFLQYSEFENVIVDNAVLPTEIKATTEVKFLQLKVHENFVQKAMNDSILQFNRLVKQIDDSKISSNRIKIQEIHPYFSVSSLVMLIGLIIGIIIYWYYYWRKIIQKIESLEIKLENMQPDDVRSE